MGLSLLIINVLILALIFYLVRQYRGHNEEHPDILDANITPRGNTPPSARDENAREK